MQTATESSSSAEVMELLIWTHPVIGTSGLSSSSSLILYDVLQQDDNKTISLTGIGSSSIKFKNGSVFDGRVIATAPAVFLDGTRFNGVTTIINTGFTTTACYGGCYFG